MESIAARGAEGVKVSDQAKTGDCCVYCSYGSVPCPRRQQERRCCG